MIEKVFFLLYDIEVAPFIVMYDENWPFYYGRDMAH